MTDRAIDVRAEETPPYTYTPGVTPHPTRDPGGHSYGQLEPASPPFDLGRWRESEAYVRGVRLFNRGYYWEAHEAWEAAWHSVGRSGPVADFLKGLIKWAAAGVKVREGRPQGVARHLKRAQALLQEAAGKLGADELGGQPVSQLLQAVEAAARRESAESPMTDGQPVVLWDDRLVEP